MKKIKKFILMVALPLCCIGCGGGIGDGFQPPLPPLRYDGTVHVIFDKVSECINSRSARTYVEVRITNGKDSFSFWRIVGMTILPQRGATFFFDQILTDQTLYFHSKSSDTFSCGVNDYQYPEVNQNFTVFSGHDVTFHLHAIKINNINTNNTFHFAKPGEDNNATKWNGGKLKN